MKTADDRIAHDVAPESIIERDNVRIRILNRILPRIISRRWRDLLLSSSLRKCGCCRGTAYCRGKEGAAVANVFVSHVFPFQLRAVYRRLHTPSTFPSRSVLWRNPRARCAWG